MLSSLFRKYAFLAAASAVLLVSFLYGWRYTNRSIHERSQHTGRSPAGRRPVDAGPRHGHRDASNGRPGIGRTPEIRPPRHQDHLYFGLHGKHLGPARGARQGRNVFTKAVFAFGASPEITAGFGFDPPVIPLRALAITIIKVMKGIS